MKSKIAILASLWVRKRTRSSSSHSSVAKKLSAHCIVVAVAHRSHRRLDAGLATPQPERDRRVLGGFKRSSQHLDSEELRWDRASVVGLIGLDVRRCVHLVDRRWPGASIDNASGKRSLEGCRARRPGRWPACPPQSEHVGSVKVVACHRSALPHCRGATCPSSSEKRSQSFRPATAGCARSLSVWAVPLRRSRGSYVVTPQHGAEA